MTLVLAVDTATPHVAVALADERGTLASLSVAEGRRHGELLAPCITQVCALAGVALTDVGLFAVDVGPGLFTGLRVGLSTVAALAHGLGRPAVGCTSLEVLTAAHAAAARPVAAIVDIRRGEVAWSLAGGEPQVSTPAEVAARLDAVTLAVGDGALRYRSELEAAGVTVGPASSAHPDPAVLAELALTRRPGELHPVYLRDADVRIGWETAPGRG